MVAALAWDEVLDDHGWTRDVVCSILEDPGGRRWVRQEVGLLALRLGEGCEHRLHVWDPGAAAGDLVIHDHPFAFTSAVVAGEITNTRYAEHPACVEYERHRYDPSDERRRVTDTVTLSSTAERHGPGQTYRQAAADLHSSAQTPGTVTVLRCRFEPVAALTVCRPPGMPWVSGRSRPATSVEVDRIVAAALEHLG